MANATIVAHYREAQAGTFREVAAARIGEVEVTVQVTEAEVIEVRRPGETVVQAADRLLQERLTQAWQKHRSRAGANRQLLGRTVTLADD